MRRKGGDDRVAGLVFALDILVHIYILGRSGSAAFRVHAMRER